MQPECSNDDAFINEEISTPADLQPPEWMKDLINQTWPATFDSQTPKTSKNMELFSWPSDLGPSTSAVDESRFVAIRPYIEPMPNPNRSVIVHAKNRFHSCLLDSLS